MTIPASQDPGLGFLPGDHVCAFDSGSRNVLDDIVVDYINKGLEAGNKVFCMVDQPSAVRSRILPQLIAKDGMLNVLTEDEAYMPDGISLRTRSSAISRPWSSRRSRRGMTAS